MINGHLKRQSENGDLEAALQLKAQMEQAGFNLQAR
jgi:hypothetical protein